jgi:hypothetical protein
MNRSPLLLLGCLWLAGCTSPGGDAVVAAPRDTLPPVITDDAPIDRWDALRPDEVTYQRPPPQIGVSRNGMDGVGGLIDDTGSGTPPGQEIDHSSPDRARQFGSSRVVDAVDLDGYVVPLGTNDAGLVDELLFVPFYGACIHVPPPPPNQIIHVTLATPIALGDLWDPYRLAGRLRVQRFDADIASASYDAAAAPLTAIHN